MTFTDVFGGGSGGATLDNQQAILAAIASMQADISGTGSETYVLTLTDADGDPVEGAAVYVTSDAIGGTKLTGTRYTNAQGKVSFNLDPGNYYAWATHARVVFTQPITITVADV